MNPNQRLVLEYLPESAKNNSKDIIKIMKTKILSLVAILAMSFALNAQVDRTKKPTPGPAPKVKLGKAENLHLRMV